MYFSSNWQVLEERVDAESAFTTDPTSGDIDRREQYIWGVRYIDDVVMHRVDGNTDGDYDDVATDAKWYHLTDAQFSTVAVMAANGDLQERVSYDPYGKARHHLLADVDGDGDSDLDDRNSIDTGRSIGSPYYSVDADFDRDGDVDMTDYLTAIAGSAAALPAGRISSSDVGNTIGWDGYVFNPETGEYTVRHRQYNTELGRWLERDPAGTHPMTADPRSIPRFGARPVEAMRERPAWIGTAYRESAVQPSWQYLDGMNLYQYARSTPIVVTDPSGLCQVFYKCVKIGEKSTSRIQKVCIYYCIEDKSKPRKPRWTDICCDDPRIPKAFVMESAAVKGSSCKGEKPETKVFGEFPYSPKNCSRSQCRSDAEDHCKKLKIPCKALSGPLKKMCKAAAKTMCEANIAACSLCRDP